MAPEVIDSKLSVKHYNEKSDIWSLGIMAIEFAESKPPFFELHPVKALFQISSREPPQLHHKDKWSSDFSDFLSHCLVKNPKLRWSTKQLLQHSFLEQSCSGLEMSRLVRAFKENKNVLSPQTEKSNDRKKDTFNLEKDFREVFNEWDSIHSLERLNEDELEDWLAQNEEYDEDSHLYESPQQKTENGLNPKDWILDEEDEDDSNKETSCVERWTRQNPRTDTKDRHFASSNYFEENHLSSISSLISSKSVLYRPSQLNLPKAEEQNNKVNMRLQMKEMKSLQVAYQKNIHRRERLISKELEALKEQFTASIKILQKEHLQKLECVLNVQSIRLTKIMKENKSEILLFCKTVFNQGIEEIKSLPAKELRKLEQTSLRLEPRFLNGKEQVPCVNLLLPVVQNIPKDLNSFWGFCSFVFKKTWEQIKLERAQLSQQQKIEDEDFQEIRELELLHVEQQHIGERDSLRFQQFLELQHLQESQHEALQHLIRTQKLEFLQEQSDKSSSSSREKISINELELVELTRQHQQQLNAFRYQQFIQSEHVKQMQCLFQQQLQAKHVGLYFYFDHFFISFHLATRLSHIRNNQGKPETGAV
eukprot:TRINITY_DN5714_c0_g1_i1.p1 TRINITY_DN5714_c0_g1~~TRINITY_DN5714_c0_g1_i1.p1  ORF type:complete len:592 (-),score=106.88 TRINITY_DN5714_c0_g1_i1:513-2288(-)